ncbi:MAG: HEAT repeat domain-containing protein, partial [Ktedonobacteraceae bacterium]|nr:HEAT repeat domain-containing protein [Ktedonobacteraceae bacterium]
MMPITSKQEKQERDTNRHETIIDILAQIEGTSFPEEIFNESEVTVRRTVTYSLKGIEGDGPVETILAALHDQDIYVRMNALSSAAELGARIPLAPIIAALDDPDYEVRATAMQVLSSQKGRVPREVFLKGLFIDCDGNLPDMGERDFEQPAPVIAAQVLAELREMRAIDPLL